MYTGLRRRNRQLVIMEYSSKGPSLIAIRVKARAVVRGGGDVKGDMLRGGVFMCCLP